MQTCCTNIETANHFEEDLVNMFVILKFLMSLWTSFPSRLLRYFIVVQCGIKENWSPYECGNCLNSHLVLFQYKWVVKFGRGDALTLTTAVAPHVVDTANSETQLLQFHSPTSCKINKKNALLEVMENIEAKAWIKYYAIVNRIELAFTKE